MWRKKQGKNKSSKLQWMARALRSQLTIEPYFFNKYNFKFGKKMQSGEIAPNTTTRT